MSSKKFGVNIDADEVQRQYESEQMKKTYAPKKTQFDTKNYLQVRLGPEETTKTLTIRLLPFSPDGGTAFKKVYMHTVKVNKGVSPSGWKTFVCPSHNKDDETKMGGKCPFCELSSEAKRLKASALDEPTKKKYGDVEYVNKVREKWIVRCIERGHEEDGVKFWLFNHSSQGNGIYDDILNLARIRSESAKKKGREYSLFDLDNGLDLIVTITKTSNGKTSIQIVDEGIPSPLSEDVELGIKWVNDDKKWYDVYTVKPYDYMKIVASGGIPFYNHDIGGYVDKDEMDELRAEAEQKRIEESLSSSDIDYSAIANGGARIIDGGNGSSDDDLIF